MDISQLKQEYRDLKRLTEQAVKSIFPIKGKKRSLELEKVWSEEKLGFEDYNSQAKTKDRQGTWGEPVYTDLKLVDNRTGETLDRAKKVRLFNIPKMTERSSYIVKGNEYQIHKQLRLKPGAYTIKKRNGELKTQFNLGRGKNFDIIFDDNSGRFFLSKIGGKAAKVPLYPILTDLGISHAAISKAWGQKLADMNRVQDPKAVAKAQELFASKGSLKEYFDKTEIDEGTTKDLLGKGYSKVEGQTLLDASRNLLQTHQEKRDPDDRDSLQFKELWSTEDFIKERLEKNKFDIARKIRRTLNNDKRTTIDKIVNPSTFSNTVESFFTTDDKSSAIEQLNPLQMLAGMNKVTIMGAGGVGSDRAVTDEMRNIHPSHFGFIDPIHTPESERIGANLNLPLGTIKQGNDIKKVVKDRSGKNVTISVKEAFDSLIAFPDQKGQRVKALHKGKMVEVDRSKVKYFTPDPSALFSWSSNLIPFLPSNQGNRAMMASKMMEQAIALKNREAPLVQVGTAKGNNDSFEQVLGKEMSKKSPVAGVVTKVGKGEISIKSGNKTTKVPLYHNFSLNRETFLNHEPTVKVGDKVSVGQIIADSNYTKDGTLALGTNLRAAYVPYKGLTFEDGIVVTESGAKKLTSEHIRKKQVDRDENTVMSKSKFKLMYPNKMTAQNLEKLDADGIMKVGSTVKMGDTVIAALRNRDISKKTAILSKTLSQRPKDISVSWNYEDDGKVTKVVNNASGVTVFIKTEEQAKIGDKLAGRFGNKGIITKIISDNHAPHDTDGKPVDIMLNPHGVISRINIGQIYESAAGKAALKTGKPVKVHNFKEKDYKDHAARILKEAKVTDKEELINPETGKSMGKVHVGNPYMLKLFKQSTSNFSARQGGPGTPYDINLQPLKAGGEEGSKALDVLTFYSMLSHGARANLREMATVKSSQNDEYWKALKSGQLLPPPKESFAYEKFTKYLKGAGIDLRKDGSKITLAPLTDKQVAQMSNGKVTTPKLFKAKNMKPEKGGVFDSVKFGGFNGDKWGHIELKEAAVNPVFEKAARSVLDIKKQYDGIIDGKLHVDDTGNINKEGKGVTGGAAIEKLLKKVDVDGEVKHLTSLALKQTGDSLDRTNKRLRFLTALKKFDLKPEEAYIRKKVPIIPPKYRPLYSLPDGNIGTSDVNVLYQNVGILNEMMGKPVMDLLPEDEKAIIRKDMQTHLDGVSGLTDLNIKGRERQGFISEIKGGRGSEGQPKEGYFISKLISKKQDFTGRGAIIPEPEFGVDEMGMPEKMAWKLFEPFVVKELRNHGKSPNQALDEIKGKTELARKALDIVMKDRKVLLNRAPSLHKFSVMAFKPKVVSGKAIKIPPLVVSGYNADFDGDTMTVHVPVSEDANKEAERMLPSRNLFQPGTGKLMIKPSQEAQLGLFHMSKTPQGRSDINKVLGKLGKVEKALGKSETSKLLKNIAKTASPEDYAKTVHRLKEIGENHTYSTGFSLGMEDIQTMGSARDKVVALANKRIARAKTQEELGKINKDMNNIIDKFLENRIKGKGNALYDMVESGARGNNSQLRQILATPMLVQDAKGKIVPKAISKSYAEGLDSADYWTSLYGARKGMMDRAIQTSLPGAFSKDIMSNTIDNVISAEDCGVQKGKILQISDQDAIGRYLAKAQGGAPRNTLIDAKVANDLKAEGFKTLEVRTPLRCLQKKGTCAYCYGIDEHGEKPSVGENIGAKAGQTMSEPLVQMVMNTFHTGGAAGTGADAAGYDRIDQLLQLKKVIPNAAPLATRSGRVTKVEKAPQGGYYISIDGKKPIYSPKNNPLKVRVGSMVSAGDPLADGVVKPQDLVKYKGMEKAQEYITDELKKAYDGQGVNIDRKVFETVVRSFGNTTKVLNNPKDTEFLPGDVVPYTVVNAYNSNLVRKVPIDETEGMKLAVPYMGLKKGHVLTKQNIDQLRPLGHSTLDIQFEAIKHAPFLKGMQQMPLLKKDWMAALGYRQLAKTLTEGAGQAWSTDLQSYHPVPAFAFGADFGKGKEGKY
jgi:DNA-directed RNA polymerase subunit beta'